MINPIDFLTKLQGKIPVEKLFATLDGRPVKFTKIAPDLMGVFGEYRPAVLIYFEEGSRRRDLKLSTSGKNNGSDRALLDGVELAKVELDFDSITKPLKDTSVLQVEVRFVGTDSKPHEFRVGYSKKLGLAKKLLGKLLPF
jgi:hypothetical protein